MKLPYGWTKHDDIKVRKYQVRAYWWVTIEENANEYNVWLENETCGVALFVATFAHEYWTLSSLIKLIDANIEFHMKRYELIFFGNSEDDEDGGKQNVERNGFED